MDIYISICIYIYNMEIMRSITSQKSSKTVSQDGNRSIIVGTIVIPGHMNKLLLNEADTQETGLEQEHIYKLVNPAIHTTWPY